ncbi:MAG: extracellular solute-binding protein [Candidatus Omnitrophica bacterium]|nr:extracellular solute-binding protein [Candidatus Omnitrophota bacterium]
MIRGKNTVLGIIFLICSISLVSGCIRQSGENLTVAMSLAEKEWEVIRREVFSRFEKETGIKVRAYQIESGELATKLRALQKAGKSEIDLFAQDNMSLAPLVTQDLVWDISDHRKDIPPEVLPNLVRACTFGGKLFFMPFRPNVQITYINKEAFERYGLEKPRTWEELYRVARIFKEKEGVGRVVMKAYGGNATATQIYEFILQAGGDPYAFNDGGCIRAFSFLQRLKPYLSPESKRAKWDTVNTILARQEAYLASNWPFGVLILVEDYGLDFIDTYSGWSGPAGEKHVIGGDVFGIPANARNKGRALEFIAFTQRRDIQQILVSKLGWPSIREDAYTGVPEWQRGHFDSVKKALQKGVFRENVPWWPAYKKYIVRAFNDIVMDGADVRGTLNDYKMKLEKDKKLYQ